MAAILAAKEQASGQSLRLQWRTFAADIMAVRLPAVISITMRIIAGYRDLLDYGPVTSLL